MGARSPRLHPTDVQTRMTKVDLVPPEIDQFTHSETVPIADQDHRSVAMTPAVLAGRLDQLLDLGLGQVLAGAELGIGTPSRRDCSIYGPRGDDSEG